MRKLLAHDFYSWMRYSRSIMTLIEIVSTWFSLSPIPDAISSIESPLTSDNLMLWYSDKFYYISNKYILCILYDTFLIEYITPLLYDSLLYISTFLIAPL